MKNIVLSTVAVLAMGSFAIAGGDFAPVEEPVVVAEPVVSDAGFYLGLGLADSSTRFDGASLNFFDSENGQDRMLDLALIAGYDFNSYVGVEGRYLMSIAYDDDNDLKAWSLFVKPQYPVTDAFNVYALLGYGGVAYDAGSTTKLDDSGFQWGLGVAYEVMDNVSVFADYTSLASGMDVKGSTTEDADVDALTLGVNYKF